jgi:hypothetical protein
MSDLGPEGAEAIIEARLGRAAQDSLEAAVVLEAWGGLRASAALALGPRVVPPSSSVAKTGRLTAGDNDGRDSVLAEGVALSMAIVAVATWAAPLSRQLGNLVLEHALWVALPLTLALQWALRSRYLSRRAGFACMRQQRLVLVLGLLALEAPLMFLHRYGPIAGMFAAIWVGGTVLARRGWGLPYGLMLIAGAVGLQVGLPARALLAGLTLLTLVSVLIAIRTGSQGEADEPAGRMGRTLWAAAIAGALGGVLVGDASLGWGVHGAFPALALLPSVLGSFWGGYHLWQFYDAVPRTLQGVPAAQGSRAWPRGASMTIFVGAMLRLLGATVLLSVLVILAGHWTSGTNRLSLFVGFGCVALVSLLVSLLESLAFVRWALAAAVAALAAEFAFAHEVGVLVPGAALIAGALVGIAVCLVPLVVLLLRPGRVLATTLWIQ